MVRIHLYPQGTRVRIVRGDFPLDPTLAGRKGTVVLHQRRVPGRYRIQLDGEDRLRAFDESELEPLVGDLSGADDTAVTPEIDGGGVAAS